MLIISDTFLQTVLYEYAYILHKNECFHPIILQVWEGFAVFFMMQCVTVLTQEKREKKICRQMAL